MIRPAGAGPVYLYALPVDMRKSLDGLAALVEQEMTPSPFESALFVFCNRSRDKLKILSWERNGFVLWYKRLEQHRFICPAMPSRAHCRRTSLTGCWMATTSAHRSAIRRCITAT